MAEIDLADLVGVTKLRLRWSMKAVEALEFSYHWTLRKTLDSGEKKFQQVVKGSLASGWGWRELDEDVDLRDDWSGVDSVHLYLGGSPTDASFLLDKVRPASH